MLEFKIPILNPKVQNRTIVWISKFFLQLEMKYNNYLSAFFKALIDGYFQVLISSWSYMQLLCQYIDIDLNGAQRIKAEQLGVTSSCVY